jgi:hypothetical protein
MSAGHPCCDWCDRASVRQSGLGMTFAGEGVYLAACELHDRLLSEALAEAVPLGKTAATQSTGLFEASEYDRASPRG